MALVVRTVPGSAMIYHQTPAVLARLGVSLSSSLRAQPIAVVTDKRSPAGQYLSSDPSKLAANQPLPGQEFMLMVGPTNRPITYQNVKETVSLESLCPHPFLVSASEEYGNLLSSIQRRKKFRRLAVSFSALKEPYILANCIRGMLEVMMHDQDEIQGLNSSKGRRLFRRMVGTIAYGDSLQFTQQILHYWCQGARADLNGQGVGGEAILFKSMELYGPFHWIPDDSVSVDEVKRIIQRMHWEMHYCNSSDLPLPGTVLFPTEDAAREAFGIESDTSLELGLQVLLGQKTRQHIYAARQIAAAQKLVGELQSELRKVKPGSCLTTRAKAISQGLKGVEIGVAAQALRLLIENNRSEILSAAARVYEELSADFDAGWLAYEMGEIWRLIERKCNSDQDEVSKLNPVYNIFYYLLRRVDRKLAQRQIDLLMGILERDGQPMIAAITALSRLFDIADSYTKARFINKLPSLFDPANDPGVLTAALGAWGILAEQMDPPKMQKGIETITGNLHRYRSVNGAVAKKAEETLRKARPQTLQRNPIDQE